MCNPPPPPENYEILHALKCVLGASEVPFRVHAYCTYIPTGCHLRLAGSDQYDVRGPSQRLHSSHVR